MKDNGKKKFFFTNDEFNDVSKHFKNLTGNQLSKIAGGYNNIYDKVYPNYAEGTGYANFANYANSN